MVNIKSEVNFTSLSGVGLRDKLVFQINLYAFSLQNLVRHKVLRRFLNFEIKANLYLQNCEAPKKEKFLVG